VPEVKKSKYLLLSIIISLLSICITVFINIQIAKEYLRVDGKTRALFGIKEIYQFGYQYCVALPVLCSLILLVLSYKGSSSVYQKIGAFALCIVAIVILLARIWRLFV